MTQRWMDCSFFDGRFRPEKSAAWQEKAKQENRLAEIWS